MAVHPPTGPFPPNDGSNIFRRGIPKPAAKPVPSADDTRTPPAPPEPAEPLDLDDEDALFGSPTPSEAIDELDAALSGVMLDEPPDDDQPVSAILLDDFVVDPTSGPTSAELLEDALADHRPPAPPSAADSSIFTGSLPPSGGVGSGWIESSTARGADSVSGDLWANSLPKDLPRPADPPTTSKFADAADLFADLRNDTPPSDSVWLDADGDGSGETGRVSESEVRRALDASRPEFDLDSEGSRELPASMPDIDLSEMTDDDADLIGGKGDATEFDSRLSDDPSEDSIFDHLALPDTEIVGPADDIDFNLPVGDPNQASSMSGRLPGLHDADPEAVAADLFGPDAADTTSAIDATDDRTPAIAAAVAAGALGGAGAARGSKAAMTPPPAKARSSSKVSPPPSRVRATVVGEDDHQPEPKATKRGGIGGLLAGLATGIALGVGGFAVVYMTGLIPNEKKTASVAISAGDPQLTAKVDQLTTDLNAANEKAEKAAADLKQVREGFAKRQTALDEATDKLRTAEDDLKTAKKQVADAVKEAGDARAAVEPLKKDLDAAKKLANDTLKDVDAAKKLAADATKERDDAKTALDVAKKDAEDKMKAATNAAEKLVAAEKKLKTADDTLTSLMKDLKANKLLDEKDDASKLPEAIQKLAAVAASGDAKKAAEALVATQKERDIARAALTKAEADAKAATDAAAKAKTDADKLVADAKKTADDKAKAAAEDATKELKKQLADATAKVATAEKEFDAKLKAMEADHAARLAEARAGVVKLVPAEMEAGAKAARSYADGLTAYRAGRYQDAENAFTSATVSQPADARFWYYLGLARTRTGTTGAADAFKKGAEMEGRNKPSAREIDAALERLSFGDKEQVNKYRQ